MPPAVQTREPPKLSPTAYCWVMSPTRIAMSISADQSQRANNAGYRNQSSTLAIKGPEYPGEHERRDANNNHITGTKENYDLDWG